MGPQARLESHALCIYRLNNLSVAKTFLRHSAWQNYNDRRHFFDEYFQETCVASLEVKIIHWSLDFVLE